MARKRNAADPDRGVRDLRGRKVGMLRKRSGEALWVSRFRGERGWRGRSCAGALLRGGGQGMESRRAWLGEDGGSPSSRDGEGAVGKGGTSRQSCSVPGALCSELRGKRRHRV